MAGTTGRIILGRHGRTVFNRDGFIMGRSDSPLTEEGVSTAYKIADILADLDIRAIYSSPLGRAKRTAGLYSERLGVEVRIRDAMAELSCGAWEGRAREEVSADAVTLRPSWDYSPPGGESYLQGESRVRPFIDELLSIQSQGNTLVVAHASVNRVFLKLWLGLKPDRAMTIPCPHDTLYFLHPEKLEKTVSVDGGEGADLWST